MLDRARSPRRGAVPQPLDRRSVLRLAMAAATTAWLPRSAWSQPRIAEDPFGLGVASGSPHSDSVVLWTRLLVPALAAEAVTVRWEVAQDEAFRQIVARGQAQALPELGHAVHVEAGGLLPGRWYHYRFMVGAWTSRTGRTRTLPAPQDTPARLRLAFASCQRWEHGWFSAWRHLRAEEPDAVLFLGDYIYEYPSAGGAVRFTDGEWATTLPQYRARYALYRSDPDLQAMHAACPWFATWDDHEVQNDYAGRERGDAGPWLADFAGRRAAAYQAFYEHMPLRAAALTQAFAGLQRGDDLRVYGQARFGRLLQLNLLDGRQYRDLQACQRVGRYGSNYVDPAACPPWNDPGRSMLGAAQEAWLDDQLAAGGATWNVLGQATLFGQRDLRPGPGQRLWNDGWDGYPAARSRLLASLQRHRVANPVLLGGDVHENWVGQVKADYGRADSADLGVEFCGTSITSRAGETQPVAERLAENPHFLHADGSARGYGLADFSPDRLEVALRVVDDVTRPDAAVATQARFVVRAGERKVVRA